MLLCVCFNVVALGCLLCVVDVVFALAFFVVLLCVGLVCVVLFRLWCCCVFVCLLCFVSGMLVCFV